MQSMHKRSIQSNDAWDWHITFIFYARGGGGVLRFGSNGGVPLKPPNLYPSLRVILAEKGTHY